LGAGVTVYAAKTFKWFFLQTDREVETRGPVRVEYTRRRVFSMISGGIVVLGSRPVDREELTCNAND
jgi:hypothetical protein